MHSTRSQFGPRPDDPRFGERELKEHEESTWRRPERREERIEYLLERGIINDGWATAYRIGGPDDLALDTKLLLLYHETRERERRDALELRKLSPTGERGITAKKQKVA